MPTNKKLIDSNKEYINTYNLIDWIGIGISVVFLYWQMIYLY